MISFDINYFAVLASGIASVLVGFAWFSPILFGNKWLAALGVTKSPSKEQAPTTKGMGKTYAASFIGSLGTAFVLAHVVDAFGALTITDAIWTGFWMWLGFIVTTCLAFMLYDRQMLARGIGSIRTHFLINISYHLVNIWVMAIILTLWI
jgi:hypothetical protein